MATATNKFGPGGAEVSNTVLLVGGAVVIVLVFGALWYAKRKVSQAVTATADYLKNDAVNVTSQNNIAAGTVNAVGQATGVFGTNDYTGKPNTFGSALEEADRYGREVFGGWW